MQRTFLLLIVAGLWLTGPCVQAQQAQLRLGDEGYNTFSFVQAIEHYEQAFQQGASSITHARRLADCYWNIRNAPKAETWFAVVARSNEAKPEDLYRYAEVLRVNGKYTESDTWLQRFAQAAPGDSRARRKADAKDRLVELLSAHPFAQRVVPVNFNSDRADLSPFIAGGGIVYFASARVPAYGAQRHSTWDDQPFLDLYTGHLAGQHLVKDVKPVDADINTRYHESNAVLSPDGQELYFTRNSSIDGEHDLDASGTNNVQIFMCKRTATGWEPEKPFIYNSVDHSNGHPALSPDGSRLYFTSDRPGGFGGKDLYMCERETDGSWSLPINLGADINTEGDEMFPFVHDSTLYFASDGHLGLGGLDLFKSAITGDLFGTPENLNAPINSTADDLGLCLDGEGRWGMFVSDRIGGQGGDDIYMFEVGGSSSDERKWVGRVIDKNDSLPVPYLPVRLVDLQRNELARTVTSREGTYEFTAPEVPAMIVADIPGGDSGELPADEITIALVGDTTLGMEDVALPDMTINSVMDLPVNAILKDAETDGPLAGVVVSVFDNRDGSLLFRGTTDENGIAQGQIPDRRYGDDMNLRVIFEKEGYIAKTVDTDFRVLMFLEQTLSMPGGEPMSAVAVGLDIAKAMNLDPIYFDYRSADIRTDAAASLDLVVAVMRMYPGMRIDLRSHTDSRASDAYNIELSQRRAAATRDYLVQQGIDAARLTAHGFGERQLINRCADGVDCSEAEHAMNRRTEFIITSVDGLTVDTHSQP